MKPITVLVDRLDDAWDGSEDSLQLIAGAARAARRLADDLKQDGAAPAIVFLRTDLWERVPLNDKNKLVQDTVTLDWSDAKRISKTANLPKGEGWNSVFTTEKMRQGTSAQRYILKRTMGRPRDVVAFAIYTFETARKNDHMRISKEDIYQAEVR